MSIDTQKVIRNLSKQAAKRVNDLCCHSQFMNDEARIKHDEDVAGIIEEEFLKVFALSQRASPWRTPRRKLH